MIEDVINAFQDNLQDEILNLETHRAGEFFISFFHRNKKDHVQLHSKITYFLATLDMKYKITIKNFVISTMPKRLSISMTFILEER